MTPLSTVLHNLKNYEALGMTAPEVLDKLGFKVHRYWETGAAATLLTDEYEVQVRVDKNRIDICGIYY